MPMNLTQFKSDLGDALKEAAQLNDQDNVDKDDALQNIADRVASAIDAYIRTAKVSTQVSTSVTGSCATPSGPGTIQGTGTGTGTGSLS